jgi:hypothetical protein
MDGTEISKKTQNHKKYQIGFYRIVFFGVFFRFWYNFENIRSFQFDAIRYKFSLVVFRDIAN